MSASLGQAIGSGNPLSLLGMGIGGAMLIGGLSVGALQAALRTKEKDQKATAAINQVWEQVKTLPESMLTSFLVGLLIGSIQRCFQQSRHAIDNPQTLNQLVNEFVQKHNLPPYDWAYQNASGDISIHWWASENSAILANHPELFYNGSSLSFHHVDTMPVSLEAIIQPGGHTQFYTTTWIYDDSEGFLSKVPVDL